MIQLPCEKHIEHFTDKFRLLYVHIFSRLVHHHLSHQTYFMKQLCSPERELLGRLCKTRKTKLHFQP